MSAPSFDIVTEALRTAGVLGETSELHGQLCGLLCQMGRPAVAPWLADALNGATASIAGQETAADLLAEVAEASFGALQAADMSLGLLLPADETPLETRAENLSYWCQGFIYGLSVGSGDPKMPGDEVIREILEDFSEITRAAFAETETAEEAETAYAELVEYVRVSVQLVFEEMRQQHDEPEPERARLH